VAVGTAYEVESHYVKSTLQAYTYTSCAVVVVGCLQLQMV